MFYARDQAKRFLFFALFNYHDKVVVEWIFLFHMYYRTLPPLLRNEVYFPSPCTWVVFVTV